MNTTTISQKIIVGIKEGYIRVTQVSVLLQNALGATIKGDEGYDFNSREFKQLILHIHSEIDNLIKSGNIFMNCSYDHELFNYIRIRKDELFGELLLQAQSAMDDNLLYALECTALALRIHPTNREGIQLYNKLASKLSCKKYGICDWCKLLLGVLTVAFLVWAIYFGGRYIPVQEKCPQQAQTTESTQPVISQEAPTILVTKAEQTGSAEIYVEPGPDGNPVVTSQGAIDVQNVGQTQHPTTVTQGSAGVGSSVTNIPELEPVSTGSAEVR